MHHSQMIINFWFEEIDPEYWWKKDSDFDQKIKDRFSEIHQAAIQCELYTWRKEPLGRLAEIIVLDQFSRNIYRDDPRAFTYDSIALVLSQEAIENGDDKTLKPNQKSFLYMPFMHSESKKIHEVAAKLFSQTGMESNYKFELKHKAIIDRFGRYPHRNKILDRHSTDEEIAFLKQPGSSF